MSHMLKVRTSDNIEFDVSLQVAQQIGLIQGWLQHENIENDSPDCEDNDDDNIITLDRVTSNIFAMVLKWCSQLLELPMPMMDWENNHDSNQLFQTILQQHNADDATMFQLIIAANFLNIESLLQAGTNYVAGLIATCNSVEEIRKRLNIAVPADFEEE